MDVRKFENLSTKVADAKERKARADQSYQDACRELEAARKHEKDAYAEWAGFVRDQAGFGDLTI